MRITLTVKLLIMAGLCVLSFLATSAILTWRSRVVAGSPPASRQTDHSWGETKVLKNAPRGARLALEPDRSPWYVASYGLKIIDVSTEGKALHVAVTADIHDTRPNMRYVWAIHVYDPHHEETTLFHKVYDDQIFSPGIHRVYPSFMDDLDLPLPKGDYMVGVGAYKIKPEEGLQGFRLDLLHRGAYISYPIQITR